MTKTITLKELVALLDPAFAVVIYCYSVRVYWDTLTKELLATLGDMPVTYLSVADHYTTDFGCYTRTTPEFRVHLGTYHPSYSQLSFLDGQMGVYKTDENTWVPIESNMHFSIDKRSEKGYNGTSVLTITNK